MEQTKLDSIISMIDKERVPQHVAVIMDGNGRWAERRGEDRIFGHQNAIDALKDTIEGSIQIGVKYLTVYAFSTENWNRPKSEVDALMQLLIESIDTQTDGLIENKVCLKTIGDTERLYPEVQQKLLQAIQKTYTKDSNLHLYLALSYSGRSEIISAVKKIASDLLEQKISEKDINEKLIASYMYDPSVPDPELMIRTSGEVRTSNFLMWQSAYTELYFTDVLWPDFRKKDLFDAIINYQSRERRFGKTGKQILKQTNF